MPEGTILVIEDEKNIASLLEMYLKDAGFRVELAGDGISGAEMAARGGPDLVLLDLMLPGMDGVEVCRMIRATSTVPIIMLTARDTEVDRVLGLEMGADDYVTKPFSPREVVARVKAVLRRSRAPERTTAAPVRLGGITIDEGRRRVTSGGEEVALTPREFDLLAFLCSNPGLVFTRDRLLERVWGYERPVDTRTVDSHVRSLRSKLGGAGGIIHTVRGVGYRAEESSP